MQLTGFLKGVHFSRITGSQIHPVRNATKSRAGCGNDAPRAEKRDTDCKVLALPSELGNPHRTRVPTFPQQRLRRRTNLPKLQNPPKSQGLTDSCAEPETVNRNQSHWKQSCCKVRSKPRPFRGEGHESSDRCSLPGKHPSSGDFHQPAVVAREGLKQTTGHRTPGSSTEAERN